MTKQKTKIINNITSKQKEETPLVEISFKKIVSTVSLIAIIFLLVYLLTAAFVTGEINLNNNNNDDQNNLDVTIQYEEILAGETFNQNATEYLVLFYDKTNTNNSEVDSLIASYSGKTDVLKLYYVDLSKKFNQSVISSTTNNQVQNAKDLKVKDPTLIKINNKANVAYYEDINTIKEILK